MVRRRKINCLVWSYFCRVNFCFYFSLIYFTPLHKKIPTFQHLALGGMAALALLAQCTVRDATTEAPTGPQMKFHLVRIERATLGTLNVKNMRFPDDLGLEPRSQLIREYVAGPLPLQMNMVLEVRDPSLRAGTLTALDYEVFVDDKFLGKAQALPGVVLPPDSAPAQFPVMFSLDTHKVLGDNSLTILRNFAVGLADRRRRPMRLALRVKPVTTNAEGIASTSTNALLVDMDSVAALTQ